MADLRKLPNLAALRAFEAAARHQNFSRAAEEIHLTHGAISHQVRALEEELGVPLFSRHGKRLTITPEGERFAATLRKSLTEIARAADAIRSSTQHKRLTITTLPSFASRWLAPRLGKFIDLHPDTEVVLQSSGQLTDFVREPVDVGIRFGGGHYPGLVVEKLMGDYYYPVASPNYNGGHLPASPDELAEYTLLRSYEDEQWTPWFHAAGVNLPEPTGGVLFQDLSMLVRQASSGRGIALVRHVVTAQEIAAGELVRLFDVTVNCMHSYYFVCAPHALHKPQVQAFRTWLLAEIEQFKAQSGWREADAGS
ncbi:MAG: Glycine cleavage system transcriptional activator GcvA [Herminiimonas sp.]|nr:Glycine cleavage system transcriptional activator GcvA [Herminiimonas sp.]